MAAKLVVSAEGTVDAPADVVYGYIADMRDHHPRFMPPAFSEFQVESGGTGAGTITRFKLKAGLYADELGRLDVYAREHRPA